MLHLGEIDDTLVTQSFSELSGQRKNTKFQRWRMGENNICKRLAVSKCSGELILKIKGNNDLQKGGVSNGSIEVSVQFYLWHWHPPLHLPSLITLFLTQSLLLTVWSRREDYCVYFAPNSIQYSQNSLHKQRLNAYRDKKNDFLHHVLAIILVSKEIRI